MPSAIEALHMDCARLGTRLFTLTTHDLAGGLFRRAYTSHPLEYPLHGTKPMVRDAWYDLCITRAEPFVANSPEEFAALYPDHALITAMGLGSAANLPVLADDGTVPATVNLLAGARHFTMERLAAYAALTDLRRGDILALALPPSSPPVKEPVADGP